MTSDFRTGYFLLWAPADFLCGQALISQPLLVMLLLWINCVNKLKYHFCYTWHNPTMTVNTKSFTVNSPQYDKLTYLFHAKVACIFLQPLYKTKLVYLSLFCRTTLKQHNFTSYTDPISDFKKRGHLVTALNFQFVKCHWAAFTLKFNLSCLSYIFLHLWLKLAHTLLSLGNAGHKHFVC